MPKSSSRVNPEPFFLELLLFWVLKEFKRSPLITNLIQKSPSQNGLKIRLCLTKAISQLRMDSKPINLTAI